MTKHDNYRHKGLRNKLVQTLKQKGITDIRVLDAIGRVPRHLFIESGFVNFAYQDKAFPIGAGQTISQPYTVAFQTQLLELTGNEKVLEIGTGSGYQAAVLMEMGVELFTIERQSELYSKTSKLLKELGYKGRFFLGDGYKGLPAHVPFDKILITAGAPFIPKDLLLQLKKGGTLIIPLGEKEQVMTKITRINDNDFEQIEYGKCAFVPMLEGVVK
ncbi:MAG: protein-L-isoaspartate(D-aspartate) O-methyltransferase [Chlorobi bacterium]|nr:protein-L-isoaspartate(D-aspartate) O-methyltransferase [Chlorobiota bacterium]